jgi:hypothetical protein
MSAVLRVQVAPMPFRWRTSRRVSRECVRTGFASALLHVSRLKEQVDSWAEETLVMEWLTWRRLQTDSTQSGWAMRWVESDRRPGESHG